MPGKLGVVREALIGMNLFKLAFARTVLKNQILTISVQMIVLQARLWGAFFQKWSVVLLEQATPAQRLSPAVHVIFSRHGLPPMLMETVRSAQLIITSKQS